MDNPLHGIMANYTSSTNLPHLVKTSPVKISFSLYYPDIDSNNYEFILSEIMTPLHNLICEQSFYVVTSRIDGDCLCQTSKSQMVNTSAPYFGIPGETVLRAAPVMVHDSSLDAVPWTTWIASFYTMQVGENILDKVHLKQDGSKVKTIDDSSGVTTIMDDILQSAFETSLTDGTMTEQLSHILPGAHLSLNGEEFETWADLNLFNPQDVVRETSRLEQQQIQQNHHFMSYEDILAAERQVTNTNKMPTGGIVDWRFGLVMVCVSMIIGTFWRQKQRSRHDEMMRLELNEDLLPRYELLSDELVGNEIELRPFTLELDS